MTFKRRPPQGSGNGGTRWDLEIGIETLAAAPTGWFGAHRCPAAVPPSSASRRPLLLVSVPHAPAVHGVPCCGLGQARVLRYVLETPAALSECRRASPLSFGGDTRVCCRPPWGPLGGSSPRCREGFPVAADRHLGHLLPLTIPSIPSPVVLLCPLHRCHPCPGPGLLPLDSVTRCLAVSLLPVVPLTRFPPSGRSVCVPCNGTSLRVNPEALAKPPACLLPTSPRLPAAPTWAFTPAPSAGGQSPCRRAHFWRPRSPPREACLDHRPSLSRNPLLSFEWHSVPPGARAVPGSAHACMMNTSSGSVFTYKMQTRGPGRLQGVAAQRDGALARPGDGGGRFH